ncbi:hypothetical protein [Microbacterium rhizomatis]|uniref:Uncharacterized protein n=1 Tax=Microbacterium rhizomatis TaxID=1631477 RepID=A0A5J5IWA6_9MICO|nr:hypothetical protein [Microbacterium rhizomatis]KAA9104994.1 hypothetical protein F6B43_18270 [Microbacterium rhizomatis]
MPDLLKTKDVKARKPHSCETCNMTAIQPGETYSRDTYVYDGRIYDWVQCAACSALCGIVFAWAAYPDEGVGRDDYTEWAREVAADDTLEGERARWYLARTGQPTDHVDGSRG